MTYEATGSPILAQQNAPILLFFVVFLIIAASLFLLYFISKKITSYFKSDEYIQNEKSRETNHKDIVKLQNKYNIEKEQASLLLEICQKLKVPNITFLIKDNLTLQNILKDAYFMLKKERASEEKINLFFKLNYSLELICTQTIKLLSTRQIPVGTTVFYISNDGEQYPFTLTQNTKDCFALEIPSFFYKNPHKPELLERIRFTFKAPNGLSHVFATRIMRYQEIDSEKAMMFVAHSNDLFKKTHRHFKREMFDQVCHFSSVQKIEENGAVIYKVSEKKYQGQLSNISGGGCCIKTPLPINEKQNIAVFLPQIMHNQNELLGIIKGTRKLPTGLFALHIQFINISIEAQNKIFSYVYKYEL